MSTIFVTGGSGFVGRHLLRTLHERGDTVRALARSDAAARTVTDAGATAIRGDLDDVAVMRDAMRGADAVVHLAAHVAEWGPRERFERANVDGTRNVVTAARDAGVPTLVHLSTEAVLGDGKPLVRVDETRTVPAHPFPRYCASKAAAERLVRAASSPTLRTVVLRPRLIWGAGDTSLLPQLIAAVRSGRFRWMGGGHYLTSTSHVANVVDGIVRALTRGRGGEVYFITDGPPVEFRDFMTRMLGTQGVDIADRSVPVGVARTVGNVVERVWDVARLPGDPPLTRMAVCMFGQEVTLDDTKARHELGYASPRSVDEGLRELAAAAPK